MKQVLIAVLAAAASPAALAQPLEDPALEAAARRIHDEVVALDTHVDIPETYMTAAVDPGRLTEAQVDLPKMRAGGLDAAFFIVYTEQRALDAAGYREALRVANRKAEAIAMMARAYPDEIEVAFTAADVRRIAARGKKVALLGMENAYPLGPSVADVEKWRAAGVRYMGVTHNGHNQFGDSCNPNRDAGETDDQNGGLTELGRALIAANNRAGIMIDVSHASKQTMLQAVALSEAPVIASHSSMSALAPVPRNMDDEQLRALAAKGGVVQIVALDAFVKPLTAEQVALRDAVRKEMNLETPAQRAAMTPDVEAEYEKRLEAMWAISPRASVRDVVDHIDHAVKVAGIDHVGIASDFDGGGGVEGWRDASETLNVTRELVRRGYSEKDIAKIWGGNLLRVMAEVERVAARSR